MPGPAGATPADADADADADAGAPVAVRLPETGKVFWRSRVDAERLRRSGRQWTATSALHAVGFASTGVLLLALSPWTAPLALIFFAWAWLVPELYVNRGAKVLRPAKRTADGPEAVALGLLGDLVGHGARDTLRATGLVVERGRLGTWVVGPQGAVLVRPGGRRLHCFCVRVPEPELPSADRVAHLLLALREDEAGFATVANGAFSGAPWRLRRRLPPTARPALAVAVAAAR